MDAPISRYVEAGEGVWIGYQVFGDGPYDLVVNDGWMGNIDANWELPELVNFYRVLGARARVITYDRRGYGISDRPGTQGQLAVEKGLEDMRSVMDAVGSERAVIFGAEAGAALSLLFVATYPERASALALMSPLVRYSPTEGFPWGFPPEEADEWIRRIEEQWGTAEFWRWNLELMGFPDTDEDELNRMARWSRLCASPSAALAIELAERDVDVRGILPTIQVPTIVLLKEGDRDGPWGGAEWVAQQIPGARYVEIPGPEHFLMAADTAAFDAIDRLAAEVRSEEAVFDRFLASVLFTDIVGSTATAASLGDRGWSDVVQKHHATVRAMLARYGGSEIDTAGDGFFASFDGPARAVHCALKIKEAVRPLGVEIRAGVHTGEVQIVDGKVAGLAVSIGSRVGAQASPSEVLVSQTVKDLVAGSGLTFEDSGEYELKGIPDRWHLYRVLN